MWSPRGPRRATPGAPAAISGPGAGYEFPDGIERLIVLADETAIPAARQLVATAPESLRLGIHVEIVREDVAIDLSLRPGDSIEWHITEPGQVPGRRLIDVVRALDALPHGTDVWAAGEASAMQAIRGHLFDTLGVDRRRATIRGYWKPAR